MPRTHKNRPRPARAKRKRATNYKRHKKPKLQLSTVQSAITKMVPQKYRFFGRTVNVTSAPQILNLSNIPFTTDESAWKRNSQKVKLQNLSYHFQIKPENDYNRVRVAIFRYKRSYQLTAAAMGQSDGGMNTICNIQTQATGGVDNPFHNSNDSTAGNTSDMSTTTPTLPWFNPRVADVIFDKVFEVNQATATSTVWPPEVYWNQSLSINKTLKYPMSDSDVAQNTINNRDYYMACWSDSASNSATHPTLNYTFKLSFKDL